jgi:hypothetical protein
VLALNILLRPALYNYKLATLKRNKKHIKRGVSAMPAEMSLFSAMQRKLLDKQAELDQACGTRYAESRATLLSLITEDLPRFQLYTDALANLVLNINSQQAQLLQRVQARGQSFAFASQPVVAPVAEVKAPNVVNINFLVESKKAAHVAKPAPIEVKPAKPSSVGKSFWATLAFIGSAFSRDPATAAKSQLSTVRYKS